MIDCFRAVLGPTPEPRLKWAYTKARQLAYNRMHSLLRVAMTFETGEYRRLVPQLRTTRLFGFDATDEEDPDKLTSVLDALDGYHSVFFFTCSPAVELVLQHLREFKYWWQRRSPSPGQVVSLILELDKRPADWPEVKPHGLRQYVRLLLPRDRTYWLSEVRSWQGDGTAWAGANFLITPEHSTDTLICDLYAGQSFPVETARHVASILATYNESTWNQGPSHATRQIWRSVALFGLRLLGETLRPGFLPMLQPVKARDGRVGYGFLCRGTERGCGLIDSFCRDIDDPTKKDELLALSAHRRSEPSPDQLWLAFLGRLTVADAENGHAAREIDCCWACFTPDKTHWYFLEHKGGAKGGGASQLGLLREVLALPMTEPAPVTVAGLGRAHVAEVIVASAQDTTRPTS